MRGWRRWRMDLAVLGLYTALTIAMTWPLMLRLNSHFAGQDVDVWLNPWATWWTEKVITEGQSLYHTDWIFYPHGVSLAFHSFFHLVTALALLLRPWLGNVGAHNATVLLAHLLSGYGMFCLVRYLARSTLGALFAGLVFAFFPYRMAESIHPHIVSTQWIPFYFLFLLRLLDEQRRRYLVPTAIFFILTALSGWHLMTLTILLTLAFFGYRVVVERWRFPSATTLNLALLTGLALAVLLPLFVPLVREQLTASSSYIGVPLEKGKGNDLIAFFLPAGEHPVWGELLESMREDVNPRHPAYLGVTVVGLGVVAGLTSWKRTRFWILIALLSMLLSIDPQLQIGGHNLDIQVPWAIPIVWLLRHPLRFNLLIGFALAVASGIGLSSVLNRLGADRSAWRWALAGVLMASLLFEYLYLPFPTTAAGVPDYYHRLAASPGEGAVLELPMGRHRTKPYMYYQTVHNKPLVEGHVSRTPTGAYDFIEKTPALRSLRACRDWALPPADLAPLLNALGESAIEYVILHKDLATPASLDLWLDLRTVPPDYEDEQIAVYRTQTHALPSLGRPQLLEGCVAMRSLLPTPVSVLQGDVMEIPLEWIAGNTPEQDYLLELWMTPQAEQAQRLFRYRVVSGANVMGWPMVSRHVISYSLPVGLALPPGQYQVRAALVPEEEELDKSLSAPILDVQVLDRPQDAAPPAVNATFGTELRLHGFQLVADANVARVILHWQALQQMEVDHKFFLHLYDEESGDLLAQADVMPHNWAYPTSWWEAGEVVSDQITLSLEAVPPGVYALGIGVYNPHTGERLTISDRSPSLNTDERRLILPETIVR